MKGIVLAGGSGTRLYPATKSISKQLLPVFDKPMIYYPLSILMLAGIRDILIITTPQDQSRFRLLLGDGSHLGMNFQFKIQPSPDGLAQAFILGKDFIGNDSVCLILGDNIYHGNDLIKLLDSAIHNVRVKNKATIFAYYVDNPSSYGVVDFDDQLAAKSIEEKPKKPKSNYAITGLYFYPNDIVQKASKVKPSARGELEITTINNMYLEEGTLKTEIMGRGFTWLDTGTSEYLIQASMFIEALEKRQGLKVACLEEIAYDKGYISQSQLTSLAKTFQNNQYGQYLIKIASKEQQK